MHCAKCSVQQGALTCGAASLTHDETFTTRKYTVKSFYNKWSHVAYFLHGLTQRPRTESVGLSQSCLASHREVGPLNERMGLSQRGLGLSKSFWLWYAVPAIQRFQIAWCKVYIMKWVLCENCSVQQTVYSDQCSVCLGIFQCHNIIGWPSLQAARSFPLDETCNELCEVNCI